MARRRRPEDEDLAAHNSFARQMPVRVSLDSKDKVTKVRTANQVLATVARNFFELLSGSDAEHLYRAHVLVARGCS